MVIEKKANFDEVFKVFAEMKKTLEILKSKQESLESSKSLTDMLADAVPVPKMINSSSSLASRRRSMHHAQAWWSLSLRICAISQCRG